MRFIFWNLKRVLSNVLKPFFSDEVHGYWGRVEGSRTEPADSGGDDDELISSNAKVKFLIGNRAVFNCNNVLLAIEFYWLAENLVATTIVYKMEVACNSSSGEWREKSGAGGEVAKADQGQIHVASVIKTVAIDSDIRTTRSTMILIIMNSASRGAFFAWRAPILSWPRIMCSQVRMLKFLEPSREIP